jgi:peroxiredoxin
MRPASGKVELNAPAPDFTLPDFEGREVMLSSFQGRQRVLLVFDRGFT